MPSFLHTGCTCSFTESLCCVWDRASPTLPCRIGAVPFSVSVISDCSSGGSYVTMSNVTLRGRSSASLLYISGSRKRSQKLHKLRNQNFKAEWSLYCTSSLTFNSSTFCLHKVFMYSVWLWEQTAIISLYIIKWLAFLTEIYSVSCAV